MDSIGVQEPPGTTAELRLDYALGEPPSGIAANYPPALQGRVLRMPGRNRPRRRRGSGWRDGRSNRAHPRVARRDPSRRFIFSIGGTSMRMYRGDPRRPPERSLRSYITELVAMQMDLPFEELASTVDNAGWVWRMAIETDATGLVVRVMVFQANPAREVRNIFEVSMRDA